MSGKDFNAIAAAIHHSTIQITHTYSGQEVAGYVPAMAGIRAVAIHLANVCAESNPRFDRNRFLTACGVNGGDK